MTVNSPNFKLMVICDLDYTLVNLNTTNELLSIVNPRKFKILSRLLAPFSILGSIFKRDFTKQVLVKSILGGISKSHLERLSLLLYKRIKQTGKINLDLLSIIRRIGYWGPSILLTASLDIIASKFRELGFNCVISSFTFYAGEKFIGFCDLYRRKYEVIRDILLSNYSPRKVIVFDDSPEPEMWTLCDKRRKIRIFIVKTL
ncbi:MAG: hypothetical protein QW096_11265 [Thermofilaceae archaeon]